MITITRKISDRYDDNQIFLKRVAYIVLFSLVALSPTLTQENIYITQEGLISFTSEAPLERITATSKKMEGVIDAAALSFAFAVAINTFKGFNNGLQQQHFYENYMESHKYPKGVFKGTITNMQAITLTKDGTYSAQVQGNLTLHGVTKAITTSGNVIVKGGNISTSAAFDIMVADFNIEIPKVVKENIAEKVKINVSADLLPMN